MTPFKSINPTKRSKAMIKVLRTNPTFPTESSFEEEVSEELQKNAINIDFYLEPKEKL